jgi:hypothetical protein
MFDNVAAVTTNSGRINLGHRKSLVNHRNLAVWITGAARSLSSKLRNEPAKTETVHKK